MGTDEALSSVEVFCMRLLENKIGFSAKKDFWQRVVDYCDSVSMITENFGLSQSDLVFLFELLEKVEEPLFNKEQEDLINLKVSILVTIYCLVKNC